MEQLYIQNISALTNPSFQQIIKVAKNNCGITCPGKQNCKPWKDLDHGVELLDSHEKLCKYLCAYGDMHEEKMSIAFNAINKPQDIFNKDITIIDWGCGQGLATLCFFDYLNQKQLPNKTRKVILIEPSKSALNRAEMHVAAYLKDSGDIILKNKFIDEVEESDLQSDTPIILHFFSNILDIPSIDLDKLSKLITANLIGEHYYFCVGPLNSKSTRIKEFAKVLNIEDEQIFAQNQGKLTNNRGSIKLLVFRIKGKEIEIIKTDYYPMVPNNINYISMIEKILRKVDPTKLNKTDKIIQFYKTVIELEQQKEPDIRALFQYPISDKKTYDISLDLHKNNDFYQEFKNNADESITRWPKDLFIGLKATLNKKSYVLLNHIIPFDEIKDIDLETQQILCKLSDFSLNLKTFEELELSEDKISEIEEVIKQEFSIEGISNVIEDKIDGMTLNVNEFYVALSSKNPALSQIYSELNRLNDKSIKKGSLLESFLMNQKIENQINNIQEEELIQISDIDDSQKNAVLNAFNNKISVITGPPGSGKTQVIMNILANAVLQNKKVLVASKNNKAVDNVKDRFNRIDEFGYFLRFGSKKVLTDITIPSIEGIISRIPSIEDNLKELSDINDQINANKQIIKDKKAILTKRDNLLDQLPDIKSKIIEIEQQIIYLLEKNAEIDFFRKLFNISELDSLNVFLKTKRNNIESKYSGLGRVIFNLFSKQKYTREILNIIEQYPFEIRNYLQTKIFKIRLSEFRKGEDIIQLYSQIITIFSNAISYIQNYSKLEFELKSVKSKSSESLSVINEISSAEPIILIEIEESNKIINNLGIPFLLERIKNKLKNAQIPIINNYKDYLPDSIPKRYDEIEYFINSTNSFLEIFNISSVTSLSAKAAFPLENELFDMVVIDEASQCDIASAIPLIKRTKQLVVIGDPLQLKHISMVNDYEETFIKEQLLLSNSSFLQYNRKSLWDYCKDLLAQVSVQNNAPLMLDRHYRCHPHIISYSNDFFYSRMLGNQLVICTTDAQFQLQEKGIIWIDIKGQQKASNINVNESEVIKSIEIASRLAIKYSNITIGIVTPFKSQAEQLNARIPTQYRNRIIADTVHKFQGDEKDVMIYSLVVTNNSPASKIRWIDESVPNLVNVAVTRARSTLYIVGNKEYIREKSSLLKPLGKLVQYVENNS